MKFGRISLGELEVAHKPSEGQSFPLHFRNGQKYEQQACQLSFLWNIEEAQTAGLYMVLYI